MENKKNMKYNFEQFKRRGAHDFDGINVRKSLITISKQFAKRIKSKRVHILFDKKSKAILIKEAKEKEAFSYLFAKSKTSIISANISKEMPLGRYYFTEEVEDGLLCIKKDN